MAAPPVVAGLAVVRVVLAAATALAAVAALALVDQADHANSLDLQCHPEFLIYMNFWLVARVE